MIYPTTRIAKVCDNVTPQSRRALVERAGAGDRWAMRDLVVVSSFVRFKKTGAEDADALQATKELFENVHIKTRVVDG